jgi:hypothetical protein
MIDMGEVGEIGDVNIGVVETPKIQFEAPIPDIVANTAELSEKPEDIEVKNIQKLEEEVVFVQDLLRTELKLDEVKVGYGWRGQNMCTAWGVYRENGLKWGSIVMGDPPRYLSEYDFIYQEMSASTISVFDHEFLHLLVLSRSHEIRDSDSQVGNILDEGLACAVEIASLNKNSNEKIDVAAVAAYNRRLVNENADVLLNPKVLFDHDVSGTDAELTDILYYQRQFYDGFARNGRSIRYNAGISFVLNVLGERLDKWTVIFDNPPTLEEIVNPDRYLERMGRTLEDFQVSEIDPKKPLITANHKPETINEPSQKPITYSFIPKD